MGQGGYSLRLAVLDGVAPGAPEAPHESGRGEAAPVSGIISGLSFLGQEGVCLLICMSLCSLGDPGQGLPASCPIQGSLKSCRDRDPSR